MYRPLLLLVILILSPLSSIFSQSVNFEDGFEDQDISDWSGTTGDFTYTLENGNTLLQQDAIDDTAPSYLSIPSTSVEGYWEFFIRMDFAPSGGNKTEIYLMSDSQDLAGNLNGYKLLAGESGTTDVFRLFRITNGAEDGEVLTGTTDISSGGDYRVKVTRDGSGNWTLEVGESYAGALSEEDTGTDNTYTSASHFGFKTTYSSTRTDLFAFDFRIDIPPLEIQSVSAISDTELDVTFSRDVDFGTFQTSDFTLNPVSTNPQTVLQEDSDIVRLTFSNPISGGEYELDVTDIDDATNETTLSDTTLSFVVFDQYQPGDVVINEFMKDPPPGSSEEYVELKNISNRYLNLRDWQIGDNTNLTDVTNADFAILPGEFAVITSDTASLSTFFGSGNYIQAPLPALNNTTDEVLLYDENGGLIDSLEYTTDWGGVDVALERRDASVSSTFQENWGDSPAANFGTPGAENQIQPDQTPPEINELVIQDNLTLLLIASERLDNSTAESTGNYTLSQNPETGATLPSLPSITSATQIAADTVELALDTELEEYDGSWTLNTDNLTDIFGNSSNEEIEFNYYVIFTAEAGQVAINEFMYDPASGFSEFVELYNHSDSSFNLQNWTLNDNTGSLQTISGSSFVLPRGEYVILAPDGTIADNFPDVPLIEMGSGFPALNNDTDAIVIRNQGGTQIDSLTYHSDWGGEEVSLERRTTEFSAVFGENWGNSPSQDLGTPGAENQIQPDQTPPELTEMSRLANDQIQLVFSERLQQSPAENTANFTLSADNLSGLPALQSANFSTPDTILLQYDANLPSQPEGTTYELSVTGQTDLFGNSISQISESFFVIDYEVADSGDIFVTEFMYKPAGGFTDYIEIYNPTQSAYNLQGWTYNDNSGNRRSISDSERILPPESRIVLAPDSAIINSFPDITLIDMGSRFANLNSTTSDDIVIRTQDGTLIDSLTYTPEWGGDEVAMERRSIGHSASFKENWGDSPSPNLGTPGAENQIQPDVTPPSFESVSIVGNNLLQVIFSERVQIASAENISNYNLNTVSTAITPPSLQQAALIAPDTVLLTFDATFPREPEGTTYELSAVNQADIFGNEADELEYDFFAINYAEPDSGKVFITEFLYDPPELYSEFVELYNPTDSTFNLRGWTFNDNSFNRRVITDTDFALGPGEFVLLTPDSVIVENFPNTPFIAMGSRFSALNNSSDAIVIRDDNGLLLDSLSYTSDWGGAEVSLERRSIDFSPLFHENWGDSPAENLGTPGQANEVEPDNEAPQIENAFILAADSIRIIFDERIKSPLANTENFSLSPSIPIEQILLHNNVITLALATSMSDGQRYTISLQNQEDLFGNRLQNVSVELEFTLVSEAEQGDVIVNEILYRRASAESEEFIELYNRSDKNFDLNNWTLSDATGSTTIPEGTQIRSGEYVVLTDLESFADEIGNGVYLSGFPSLNDDEDAIVIKNNEGLLIDSLFYNETWGGNKPGVSLERKDPESASNDASNWATSTSENGYSAGVQSSVYHPDEIPPDILFAKLQSNGKIFVAFSEFVKTDNTEVLVNDEPVTITGHDESDGNIVILGENSFSSGEPINVLFKRVTDFRGNAGQNLSVEVSQPLNPQSVVINEILFDPLANTDDNLPDQTEYIELHNRGEYAISLEGFYLHDEPDENNDVRTIYPVTSQFKWIPSGGYVVVYAENTTPNFEESQLAEYFELQNVDDQFYVRTDRSSLSLASSDDAIYLADSTGVTIDSVFYNESWQNPNLHDTKGVALERVDPDGPSNDEANWSSSTRVSGGTPGEQNSIYQKAGAGPDGVGINFTPNPFSPDDDGYEDNLFINYRLDEPDYLLRVRIFDRYGREVRKLADGEQAGFEGSLIWDGLTDDRRKNRVGIYIVYFEAYNSADGKNKTFKKTVVLARKF